MASIREKIVLYRLKNAIKRKKIKKITKIVNKKKYNDSDLDDKLIIKIINIGYVASEDTPVKIKNNAKYLEIMLEKNQYSTSYIDWFDDSILKSEIILRAINNGYFITCNTPKKIASDTEMVKTILKKCMKFQDEEKMISTLKNCDLNIKKSIIIDFFTKTLYPILGSDDFDSNNIGFIRKIYSEVPIDVEILNEIISSIDYEEYNFIVTNIINSYDFSKLSDDIIKNAIKKGYIINERTLEEISNNYNYIHEYAQIHDDALIKILKFGGEKILNRFNETEVEELIIKLFCGDIQKIVDSIYNILKLAGRDNNIIKWYKYITWFKEDYFYNAFNQAGYNIDEIKALINKYNIIFYNDTVLSEDKEVFDQQY